MPHVYRPVPLIRGLPRQYAKVFAAVASSPHAWLAQAAYATAGKGFASESRGPLYTPANTSARLFLPNYRLFTLSFAPVPIDSPPPVDGIDCINRC